MTTATRPLSMVCMAIGQDRLAQVADAVDRRSGDERERRPRPRRARRATSGDLPRRVKAPTISASIGRMPRKMVVLPPASGSAPMARRHAPSHGPKSIATRQREDPAGHQRRDRAERQRR